MEFVSQKEPTTLVGSAFGGPGGASDSESGAEARTYQHQAVTQGQGVWGAGCVLEGAGAFPLDVDGWVKGRVGMASPVEGPGRAEAWRQGRAGCALDLQAGRALNILASVPGWSRSSLSEASGWVWGQEALQPPFSDPGVSTAALLLAL